MSTSNLILEGLRESRIKTVSIRESYDDLPVCHKSREFQKVLSDAFSRKYLPIFKTVGAESMGVEVYTHEDSDPDDVIRIDDVVYEVTLYIDFDIRATVDVKSVNKMIASTLKRYPKFSFDKTSKQFYSTAETPDEIFDVIDSLKKDGAITKLLDVKSGSEIESEVNAQLAEWKRDKAYQEAEYRRDVLGTF